jgi:hypothetical protein
MVLVHLHVHGVCPCPCFMSMLNAHVPVHVPVHVHATHHRCLRVGVRVGVRVRMRVHVHVYRCRNARLTGIRSVRYRNEKLKMPGQARYWTKPRLSGIFLVRYWTEIVNADAGVSFLDADAQLCTHLTLLSYLLGEEAFLQISPPLTDRLTQQGRKADGI